MVKKIREALNGSEHGKTIAVLGLSFKPETDDMREAPAVAIIPALQESGAAIQAYDPHAMSEAKKLLPQASLVGNAYDACRDADAVVLVTEWNEFRSLDLQRLHRLMRQPVFVDLRSIYDADVVRQAGFRYYGVGMGQDD